MVNQVFQLSFYIAAYTEAINLSNNPHLLRPAAHRTTELLDFELNTIESKEVWALSPRT
jgi:hypothetical protein